MTAATPHAIEIPSADRRDSLRTSEVAATPGWYNPWVHLGATTAIGVAILVPAILAIRDLRTIQLLTIPITWVIANATEWRAHRDLLHRRQWFAPRLYDQHTPIHHMIYVTDDMAMRDWREFRLVLIPAYGIGLIFVATLPATLGMWRLGWHNVAALFAATCMAYVLSYEWLHLSYHLGPQSPIGRLGIIRVLRRHHATHHDPRLMQTWNFNVTVPLWDWVRRTIYHHHGGEAPMPPASRS